MSFDNQDNGGASMKKLRAVVFTAAAVALAVVLAACGSSSKSKTSTSSSSAKPGAGKPPIVIGDKNFSEEFLLGDLYAQALQAKGYKVSVKGNIGSTEITYKALTSGQIQMYPEYTGVIVTVLAGITTPPHSAAQTFSEAKTFVQKHGFTLLNSTPYYNADAMGTLKSFATAHHLHTITDLKQLGHSLKLGAAPEFATRFEGLVGLKKLYGLNPTFKPIAIGLTYKALDSHQVQVADVFTTDPQLLSGKYAILTDPKNVFGYQNVAPIVKASVVKAEGPAFAQTLNKVSSLLTLNAVRKMNNAVAVNQESPAKVAHQFLAANGLA
jgi:osmoprotectant transport system substrate-binding protein